MTQPHAVRERLRRGDMALVGGWGVSTNEAHAFALGLCLGVLARRAGRPSVALGAGVWSLVGWSETIGVRTMAREPWYALAGVVMGVRVASPVK